MVEATEIENLEFKWGKKRGIGGKKKDVQFYESFTYDGLDYTLYDNVYLHKEGEPLPYLGKLIKIWENPDKSKKVKVLWFFQPFEISNYLVVELTHPNEVFLASGEGVGLANVNPLEAIAGKCNVVCISKDSRNPQPSDEELQMADFVYYRTFDVGQHIILDKIDDKVAGIDVKFIFNQVGSLKPCSVHNFSADDKHASENAMETNERAVLSKLNSSENHIAEDDRQEEQKLVVVEKLAANDGQENGFNCKIASNVKVEENSDVKVSSVKPNFSQREKPVSGVVTKSGELARSNDRLENTSGDKIGSIHKVKENEDLKGSLIKQENTSGEKIGSVSKSFVNKVKVDEKLKSIKELGEFDEKPRKRAKIDSSVKVSNDKNKNKVLKPNCDSDGNNSKSLVPNITASEDKSRRATDPLWTANNSSKKLKIDDKLTKPTNCKSPEWPPNDGIKTGDKALEVTRRPDSDRSKWFAELPWEERMQDAHEHGTLVLFQNLDSAYTSADVEDIVWNVFKETCRAKMVQRTAYSSQHSGHLLPACQILAFQGSSQLLQAISLLINSKPNGR
ncbi:protein ANTI-SILENCING 1 isoform X2 [Durio zibethinus]|uniref:Protein ANTI-SILENCING 1 isoform X2 n=1 Tax=Durio zibethinus TaxID=66656 RepID=A0A6P5XQD1_DURZI|nr:protein ANTI-SILENCING 1 isoform X2 [Durio zibethinus]